MKVKNLSSEYRRDIGGWTNTQNFSKKITKNGTKSLLLNLLVTVLFSRLSVVESIYSNFRGIVGVITPSASNIFVCYTVGLPLETKSDRRSYSISSKEYLEISKCFQEVIDICGFKDFEKSKIYVRFIYYDISKLKPFEIEEEARIRRYVQFATGYHKEENYDNIEFLNPNMLGFYNSFAITYHKLPHETEENNIVIISKKNLFSIGFLTKTPKKYDSKFIRKFRYKNAEYYAFSNRFECISLDNIRRILYQRLISNHIKSQSKKPIKNPCMYSHTKVIIQKEDLQTHCAPNFPLESSVKMEGFYEFETCVSILEELLYDEDMCPKSQYCNFSTITKDFLPSFGHHILLYGDHISKDDLNVYQIKIWLNVMANMYCDSTIKIKNKDICLDYAHLYAVLYMTQEKSLNTIQLDIMEHPDKMSPNYMFIFGDQRFGVRFIEEHQVPSITPPPRRKKKRLKSITSSKLEQTILSMTPDETETPSQIKESESFTTKSSEGVTSLDLEEYGKSISYVETETSSQIVELGKSTIISDEMETSSELEESETSTAKSAEDVTSSEQEEYATVTSSDEVETSSQLVEFETSEIMSYEEETSSELEKSEMITIESVVSEKLKTQIESVTPVGMEGVRLMKNTKLLCMTNAIMGVLIFTFIVLSYIIHFRIVARSKRPIYQ